MARYDYRCVQPECAVVREVTHGMSEAPIIACEDCGSDTERLISDVGMSWNCAGSTRTLSSPTMPKMPTQNYGHTPLTAGQLGLNAADCAELGI